MTDKTVSSEPVSTAGLQVEEPLDIERIELTSRMRMPAASLGWETGNAGLDPLELPPDGDLEFDFEEEAAAADGRDLAPPAASEQRLELENLNLAAELAALRGAAALRERALEEQLERQAELLEEREIELFRQSAQISSLTLERDGLHARLQESGTPVPLLAPQPARSDDHVARLKERLDERGRALAVAREEIDRLRREGATLAAALQERAEQVNRLLDQLKRHDARRRFDGDFRRAFARLLRGRRKSANDDAQPRPRGDAQFMGAAAEPTVVLDSVPLPRREAPVPPQPVESRRGELEAAAATRRYLVPLEASSTGVYELTEGRHYVGRGAEASLRLVDSTVSRLHAVLRLEGERVLVQDAASTNGVYVNGQRVRSAELQDFDTVAFGEVGYLFRLGTAVGDKSRRDQ